MSVYALWNNKGGVGKSYLTFQIACQYAITHPAEKVLVVDMCPQANSSGMLLGGIIDGEARLNLVRQFRAEEDHLRLRGGKNPKPVC